LPEHFIQLFSYTCWHVDTSIYQMLVIVWLIIECEKDRGNILSRHLPYRSRHFHLLQLAMFSAKKRRGQSRGERERSPVHTFGKVQQQNRQLPKQLGVEEKEGARRVEEGGGGPSSPFKVNPTSLLAILNEQSIPTQVSGC